MKFFHYLAFSALFGIFFWTGLWTGRKIGVSVDQRLPETYAPPQTAPENRGAQAWERPQVTSFPQTAFPTVLPAVTPISKPDKPEMDRGNPFHQRNILVIGVDNLEAPAPRLESVWLILYLTETPIFTLMPLYPSVLTETGQPPQEDRLLAENFGLEANGLPVETFLATLKEWGIWWSAYILLDEAAMVQGMGLVAQMDAGLRLEGEQLFTDIPSPWEDFNAAYKGQTWLVQRLCASATLRQAKDIDLSPFFNLIPHHLRTDLNAPQIAAEWLDFMAHGGGIRCELPFLQENP